MSSFNQSDWSFPKKVQTPNIKEDIKTYLSDDILSKFNACTNQEVKDKIVRVTEMLEFIGHLNAISGFLHSKDKKEVKCVGNNIYVISHIEFESHDYSGFDYDCEALTIYLLLSLIDTCVGQKNCSARKFKKAFTDFISPDLKSKICSSLFYFQPPKEGSVSEKMEKDYSEWENMNEDKKMMKIASGLYSSRCEYTHCNIRRFIPNRDTCGICVGDNDCFLCKKSENLPNLLKQVIRNLTDSLLDGRLV